MPLENSIALTAVQQGMLYHHLGAPASGVDLEQMVAILPEPLDPEQFRGAWDQLINCHAAFRSSFEWQDRPVPVRVEHAHVSPMWQEHDLRDLSPEQREQRVEEFLIQDRRRGFDLQVAPLSRGTLFHTEKNEWIFVWTFHHILADGYSYPAVIQKGFALYEAVREGKELRLPPERPHREFMRWLAAHLAENRPRAEVYWRETMRGFSEPTPLPGGAPVDAGVTGVEEKSWIVSESSTKALAEFAGKNDLTMSSLVQAAWALVLGTHAGHDDVVFGVTRSGRRSGMPGAEEVVGVLINTLPVRVRLDPESRLGDWLSTLRDSQKSMRDFEHTPLVDIQLWSEVPPGTPLFDSIVVFTPRLVGATLRELGGPWAQRDIRFLEQTNYPLTLFAYNERELLLKLAYDRARFSGETIEHCLELLATLLEAMPGHASARLKELPLVSEQQKKMLLVDWNATQKAYQQRCIHELFEAQAERTPEAAAVVFRERSLSYQELNSLANQLASRLRSLGCGPGQFVGVFLRRSLDLMVALLAALKAGAAYLPMDPTYPRQRLNWMLEDTTASFVLTQRELLDRLPADHKGQVICLDDQSTSDWRTEPAANLAIGVSSHDVAYVIFTSGSSGRSKGVLVEHRNVANFFCGMDQCLDFNDSGAWLAVTSISFDISVLELFWALARGFKVVLQEEPDRLFPVVAEPKEPKPAMHGVASVSRRKMDFSLFYFAADAGLAHQNRYRLLLEGSRFADSHGFAAVWTPERHFHAFGGLYPNPSVTAAAVAAITSRVQIRAGSIVLPLHNPIRVAEEWAVVDNLSQGRVGLSFASGWHANDFALMPQNYAQRKEIMLKGIDTIRRLWRGETVPAVSGSGQEVQVRIFPAPAQEQPPIWLTSAGNIETFRQAGLMGFNVLTNLLGQQLEELAAKLAAYRLARHEGGHRGKGQVTLMLHTFIGPDLEEVRRKVRQPFLEYLKTSTDLIQKARWEFPAFATAPGQRLEALDDDQLSSADMKVLMDFAFDRYFQTSGLFGTPRTCLEMVDRLKAIDVDEIACLIDFGVDSDSVLDSLQYLDEVRKRSEPIPNDSDYSIASQIIRHRVTHLQCTPSLARILVSEANSLEALRPLSKLLVGGEAIPPALAAQLAAVVTGELINVYGPTETTVWSTAARIDRSGAPVTIGRPLANTQLYVVDRFLRPLPIGVSGELLIGGHGVARGYLNQQHLTEERFIPDPFGPEPGGRLYRTGDLVRYRQDGQLEFIGRLDHQVKIRGYRIELGEIESVLGSHPAVDECLVVAREQAGEQNLFAYVAAKPAAARGTVDGGVGHWRTLWDTTYETSMAPLGATASEQMPVQHAAATDLAMDPTLNTSGWTSSFTGQRIPDAEMREWVQHTVERIVALKPARALEIGCGTGMLLFRIAPQCEHYCGVDFSANALRLVETEAARQSLGNLTLLHSAAHELAGLEPQSFDVVILNSVIQYFSTAEYLVDVLAQVIPLVREEGTIFIGDVRNLDLNEAFQTAVALELAPADLKASELRQRVRQRLEHDQELVLDPSLFLALPQEFTRLDKVTIQLKRGRSANEMTRFRYDVLMTVGGPKPQRPSVPQPARFDGALSLAEIRSRLATEAPMMSFAGIANPRVHKAVLAAKLLGSESCPETAGDIQRQLASVAETGIDPEDLYTLDVPYEIEAAWSVRGLDRYDAVFRRAAGWIADPGPNGQARPETPLPSHKPWHKYSNRPGTGSQSADLALELKDLASQRLPPYMVPTQIIVLEALPRTPNGKVDRKALPESVQPALDLTKTTYVEPATDLEKAVSTVLQELLHLDRVGTQTRFFDMGANSLLLVQATSRLRTSLRRELSLVDLFQFPTVKALAAHLAQKEEAGADEQKSLKDSQERGRARLYALRSQKRPGKPAQNS